MSQSIQFLATAILGLVAIGSVASIGILSFYKMPTPDVLGNIVSGCVGALAGMLVQHQAPGRKEEKP